VSLSPIPLKVMPGDSRSAVRSGPMASLTASTTSTVKRRRPAIEPPYASVRRLVESARNWWSRKPFAPCSSTPSKPASMALREAVTKSATVRAMSSRVISRGTG
jgi:hypothetical protein